MSNNRRLAAVRRRIDRLDEQLLRLLNARARLALEIGRIKRRKKWPVFDPRREMFVLRHVASANGGPLSARAVRKIFQTILTQCRRRERDGKRRKTRRQ
ncbi:MAG: hypothetical protein A3B78_00830 [Omnitrophica WOR_2 bacterium RIFCSPHIGHO2_02_FULL_67_20]|nr:MAG: hypothetical protein A3B78_00830 [Omnitrophica WOR_2 bacterium RIFCSPHIGHO2_02_FULL_67_20]